MLQVLMAVLTAGLMICPGCGSDEPAPKIEKTGYMYIGLVAPQSGPLKELGQDMVEGARMAVLDINKSRSGKRPVKVLFEDETQTKERRQLLAHDPRVAILAGHLLEKSLKDRQETYIQAQKPLILPIIGTDKAPDLGGGLFFRLPASDLDQARSLAGYAVEKLHPQNVLIVFEDSNFGRGLSQSFSKGLEAESKIRITEYPYPTVTEGQPAEAEGLAELAQKTAALNPDLIFLALHARQALFLAQTLSKKEVKAAFMGTYTLALNDAASFLSRLNNNIYISLPFDSSAATEGAKIFIKKYQAIHRQSPNWLTILTYDAVNLAAQALDQAGDEPVPLKQYLDSLNNSQKSFPGLAGQYYFKPQGRGLGPVYIVPLTLSLSGRLP